MKIGVLTFEQFHRKTDIGSTRIRADWLIKNWPEAERMVLGKKYDVMIFQKVYWPEFLETYDGIKILDICDGDFLDWGCRLVETLQSVDGVVCSTQKLADQIKMMTDKPVMVIPDRLDLEFHKQRKIHQGRAKNVVWFGYSHNTKPLETVLPFLEKNKLGLICISNRPFIMPVSYIGRVSLENYTWNINTVNDDIIKADMVVNPTYKYGNWQFKSNNKTLTSWALGMPVADTPENIVRLLDEPARKQEVKKRLQEIKEKYDVKLSVKEYKEFIDFLYQREITQNV